MKKEIELEIKKRNNIQWVYSALCGLCITYFFALLSSNTSGFSIPLFISSLCFACLLPITAGVAVIQIKITAHLLKTEIITESRNPNIDSIFSSITKFLSSLDLPTIYVV